MAYVVKNLSVKPKQPNDGKIDENNIMFSTESNTEILYQILLDCC